MDIMDNFAFVAAAAGHWSLAMEFGRGLGTMGLGMINCYINYNKRTWGTGQGRGDWALTTTYSLAKIYMKN